LALWLQEAPSGGFTPTEQKWIVTSLVVIAAVVLLQGFFYLVAGIAAMKAIREAKTSVDSVRNDLLVSKNEFKEKIYPLLDGINRFNVTVQDLLEDSAPKIKAITENLTEASRSARNTAQKLEATVNDANLRTRSQIARVDTMVTGALNTTAEVAAAIEQGIRGPVQKIAVVATQARAVAEGLLSRLKASAGSLSFLQPKTVSARPVPPTPRPEPPTPRSTVPPSSSGTVPTVR
jgi:hypothetical protein